MHARNVWAQPADPPAAPAAGRNAAVLDFTQTERYRSGGALFARVLAEAAYLTRCSGNKTACLLRPVAYAIRHRYMQINRPMFVSWLVFDLDHGNAMIWSLAELAAPNLIVRDPETGRSHLYYAIHPVYTGENARAKPQQYMKAIYAAYCRRLDADPSYRGPVARTPGHACWETTVVHERTYSLGELAQYVDLVSRQRHKRSLKDVAHSRHCILFEELRYFAYDVVAGEREHGTYAGFMRLLEGYACERNTFGARGFARGDLSAAEVRATVRSVGRWTWDHYFGRAARRRGLLGLSAELPLAERQRLGALHTHGVRREGSAERIARACATLRREGARITFSAIARLAGLARQTVARYRALLGEPTGTGPAPAASADSRSGTRQPVAAPAAGSNPTPGVTFGGHQITGAPPSVLGAVAPVVQLQILDG